MARTIPYDQLRVRVFDTVAALAAAAADDLAAILRQAIAEHGTTAAIFATGNSQLAFYQALQARIDTHPMARSSLPVQQSLLRRL